MPIGIRMAIFALVCLLFAAPAQAAQLFPLQTGNWMELDKQDNQGNKWTERFDVLEEVTLDGTKYFHVRVQNSDPLEGDVLKEVYVRSTDTEAYTYNGPGAGETLALMLGQEGTSWTFDGGAKRKEIVAIEPITIPYGGTYTAYKYKQYRISEPDQYYFEWVVPGLGIAKDEDHWVWYTRIPVNGVLARAGMNPFLPFKTGMVMEYNSSDNVGHTWHMRLQVLGQVTLGGKQYYHMRQFNYDPYHQNGGPNTLTESYIRGEEKAVYKYNGVGGENILAQAANKLTSWTRPGNGGTITTQIVDIVQVTVPYGGPLTAYKHQLTWTNGSVTSPPWNEYVVPGISMVKIEDNDDNGRTFSHVLARMRMGSASPAVNLLLLD